MITLLYFWITQYKNQLNEIIFDTPLPEIILGKIIIKLSTVP